MDFIFSGETVVCDFTVTHDCGSRIQQQFYVLGLMNVRRNLVGEARPFGEERTDGVVVIRRDEFIAFRQTIRSRILKDPVFCYYHIATLNHLLRQLAGSCRHFEEAFITSQSAVAKLFEKMMQELIATMSYNVLYKIFPEEEIFSALDAIFPSTELARRTFIDLHFSSALPHYTRINLALLHLGEKLLREACLPEVESFIREVGFAFDFYIHENELERKVSVQERVIELAQSFDNDAQKIQQEYRNILNSRERQKEKYFRAWKSLCRTMRERKEPGERQLQLMAALGLCQALATEEEERHFLQMRVQRNCRWVMERMGTPLTTTSLETLFANYATCD
jgi:hypothetical protein